MTESELLFRACCIAEVALECDPEGQELYRQILEYRISRWGQSKAEKVLETAKPMSVFDVAKEPKPAIAYEELPGLVCCHHCGVNLKREGDVVMCIFCGASNRIEGD